MVIVVVLDLDCWWQLVALQDFCLSIFIYSTLNRNSRPTDKPTDTRQIKCKRTSNRHVMNHLISHHQFRQCLKVIFGNQSKMLCSRRGFVGDGKICTSEFQSGILWTISLHDFSYYSPGLYVPSVLWCWWLGGRKGIRPVKNWVVGCWHGYLSGARCGLAYGPADATATNCLMLQ